MDISQRIKNFFVTGGRAKNDAAQVAMGTEFLKYGNRRQMMNPDWGTVQMSDLDFYSGYSYAAINNRANKVSQLAIGNLDTTAVQSMLDDARTKDLTLVHPYLTILDNSTDFTASAFWYAISTYLDLEGVYYLMAIRAVSPNLTGDVQSFKMLNPYNIQRVKNRETMEIGGYIETRDGLTREIPKEMIIEIRKLNPFNEDQNFAMTDAAKEYQFTMKQASDYSRSSLKNNISSPGIIATDVLMEDELFANFKARVQSQERGAPIFANGAKAVNWTPMNVDLDKAALNDINSINRDTLFAVTGVSKTIMGIEESGTTREVSQTQKEKFLEDHIIPQLQLIVDALNQDYKTYYSKDYQKNNYNIIIDSPMAADKDSDVKDIQIAQEAFDLYVELVDQGYDRLIAAKYSEGELTLAEIGEPTNPPKDVTPIDPDKTTTPTATPAATPKKTPKGPDTVVDPVTKKTRKKTLKEVKETPPSKKKQALEHEHEEITEEELSIAINELGEVVADNVQQQSSSLQNAVQNIEAQVIAKVVNNITTKNAFDSQGDIVSEKDKKQYITELALAVSAYYLVLFPIYGNKLMRQRASEYGTLVPFAITDKIKKLIESVSQSAAESHVNTVAEDILTIVKNVNQETTERELKQLLANGNDDTVEIRALAKEKALSGANQQEIVSAITSAYQNMAQTRAKIIAKNEAQRAFTQSQYQADLQFLKSTNLLGKAYKQLQLRNPDACGYCRSIADQPPIPFEQNFADLGDNISATITRPDGTTVVKKLPVNYEAISAGNVHVHCYCRYILIIK